MIRVVLLRCIVDAFSLIEPALVLPLVIPPLLEDSPDVLPGVQLVCWLREHALEGVVVVLVNVLLGKLLHSN